MKIFNDLKLKFEHPDWSRNPEFGLIDTILEQHPELWKDVRADIIAGTTSSHFGRKDTPTVEQIMRAALYKELKGMEYRDLEYAQSDSRICATFIKLDERKPFSFQVFQKFISKVSHESLQTLLIGINRLAIEAGLEDINAIRTDSTVVKSNIHYPTNNALVWDSIKESHRLLDHLAKQTEGLLFRDYRKSAKRNYYKINNTKSRDKRADLFRKQLTVFTKAINQVDQVIRNPKKKAYSLNGLIILKDLMNFLPTMRQVYDITKRKELLGEKVPNEEKIFSIYEPHTDIIVKGGREVEFGHKVQVTGGKSNLLLDCMVLDGNPSDKSLYKTGIKRINEMYRHVPRDVAVDGGYASKENLQYAKETGIQNIVFNKVVGSLTSQTTSKKMETQLKKWRSGIEAVISNYKRSFSMRICNWKGIKGFKAKVLWSAIAYNIKVLTRLVIAGFQFG